MMEVINFSTGEHSVVKTRAEMWQDHDVAEEALIAAATKLVAEPWSAEVRSGLRAAIATFDAASVALHADPISDEILSQVFFGSDDREAKQEWEDTKAEAGDFPRLHLVVDPDPWDGSHPAVMAEAMKSDAQAEWEANS